MKKYNRFLLEGVNIDIDSFMKILKQTKEKDIDLFNKIINKDKEKLFKEIKKSKNQEYLKYAIDNVDDINFKNKLGRNILFDCRTDACVEYLLDVGVDPTVIDNTRKWSLIYVFYKYTNIRNLDLFQKLIRFGVDIKSDNDDLIKAALNNIDDLKFFIKNGLVVNDDLFFEYIRNTPHQTKSELLNTIKVIKYLNISPKKPISMNFSRTKFNKIELIMPHIWHYLDLNRVFSSSYDGSDTYFRNIDYILKLTRSYELYKFLSNLTGDDNFKYKLENVLKKHNKLKMTGKFNL